MSELMFRGLYRWEDDEGNNLYYAGGWQTGSKPADGADMIGVCSTRKNQRPSSAEQMSTFAGNVGEVAVETRWFDEPMEGEI